MAKKKVIFLILAIPALLGALKIFRYWLGLGVISAGDLGFFYPVNIREYWQFPLSWESFRNSGLGGYALPFQHLYFLNFLWGFLGHFSNFILIERLVWFWPIIFLGVIDAYLLANYCGLGIIWFPLVWVVLILNTYFLTVASGGQITVAFGYLMFGLTFVLFLKVMSDSKPKLSKLIYFSWALVLMLAFDPRFIYLFVMAAFFYFFFDLILGDRNPIGILKSIIKYLKVFIPAGLVTLAIHFYWLLPLLIFRRSVLPEGYEKADWLKFLSFADFSDTISLLHPNWPENIFGKTYFFRPEFLIMPILAYSSLFFVKKNKSIIYFSLLGLIGAFLAKGTNPPFGQINNWLFNHFPGMNLFRDPLKFYTFLALSYAVLIPYSVSRIYQLIKSKTKSFFPQVLLVIFIGAFLSLVKPALFGEIGGTFKTRAIPEQYIVLKNFLENQQEFFRTLWLPRIQRFGYYSNNHPAINSESFMTDSVCREPLCSLKTKMPEKWGNTCSSTDRCYIKEISYFLNPQVVKVLSQLAVKYVIVPLDTEGEIFIVERQYNHQQRQEVEQFLDMIPWLKKIELVNKIAIYELSGYKDHFFVDQLIGKDNNKLVSWKMINPAKYIVYLSINKLPAELVFSESYDQLWQARLPAGQAKLKNEVINSKSGPNYLNNFQIDQSGELELTVEHAAQKAVNYGSIISILGLFFSGVFLFFSR